MDPIYKSYLTFEKKKTTPKQDTMNERQWQNEEKKLYTEIRQKL